MATTTKTTPPEDFALTILDELMEDPSRELSTFQLLQAANAYATAGLAQVMRTAQDEVPERVDRVANRIIYPNENGGVPASQFARVSAARAAEEKESRLIRLGRDLPVLRFVPNAGIPGAQYKLVSNGVDSFWIHENATTEEIETNIDMLQSLTRIEEEAELEHVDVSTPPKVVRAYHGKPEGDYDFFDRDEGKFWVHRSVTLPELDTAIKAILAKEDAEWEAVGAATLSSSTLGESSTSTVLSSADKTAIDKALDKWKAEQVWDKEPTKELPKSLRQRIEEEIAERAKAEALREKITEGMESGEGSELTPEHFDELRSEEEVSGGQDA